nr:hypothetical protein [Tanacetum cinerariifolium]
MMMMMMKKGKCRNVGFVDLVLFVVGVVMVWDLEFDVDKNSLSRYKWIMIFSRAVHIVQKNHRRRATISVIKDTISSNKGSIHEVVDCIHEGGDEVVDTQGAKNVNYIVESYGVQCSLTQFSSVTNVFSHWIRLCFQAFRYPSNLECVIAGVDTPECAMIPQSAVGLPLLWAKFWFNEKLSGGLPKFTGNGQPGGTSLPNPGMIMPVPGNDDLAKYLQQVICLIPMF